MDRPTTIEAPAQVARTHEVPLRVAMECDLIHFDFQIQKSVFNYGMYLFLQNKQGHLECYVMKDHGTYELIKKFISAGKAFLPITETIRNT